MVEFNVIQASILKGWLFHPYGRTSRFGAKYPAPLYYRSSDNLWKLALRGHLNTDARAWFRTHNHWIPSSTP